MGVPSPELVDLWLARAFNTQDIAAAIKQLTDLINEVYDDAESGMWKRPGTRTNPGEVARLLRNQALILVEIDGRLVGAVNVNLMSDGIGEFGMLMADLHHRGKGIGSALVDRAENWARQGMSHNAAPTFDTSQLDSPQQGVPEVVVLQDWVSAAGN